MNSDLIARARAGDEEALRHLVDRHQRELHVHCYRILGSIEDAEDQVQETFLAGDCGPKRLLRAAALRWSTAQPGMECWSCGELNTRRRRRGDMPIPKVVGQWNKAGLNRLTRHIAPWMPGLGVVVHRGRRSGRRYQTPVNVFSADNGYVIALTYGPETDWVKNVLAAGSCELRTRGQTIPLGSPRVFHDQSRSSIRPIERQVLRIFDVADFLSLTRAPVSSSTPGQSPA